MMKSNVGWGKNINDTLLKHKLPTETKNIEAHSRNAWRTKVKEAIEKANKNRLHKELHKEEDGVTRRKTKTREIVDYIENEHYQREVGRDILQFSKQETKTLIISRYRMLECGNNFKGTHCSKCEKCLKLDDEEHRLNHCVKYRTINHFDDVDKVDFQMIYSTDCAKLKNIIHEITKVWNLRNSHGTMNIDLP